MITFLLKRSSSSCSKGEERGSLAKTLGFGIFYVELFSVHHLVVTWWCLVQERHMSRWRGAPGYWSSAVHSNSSMVSWIVWFIVSGGAWVGGWVRVVLEVIVRSYAVLAVSCSLLLGFPPPFRGGDRGRGDKGKHQADKHEDWSAIEDHLDIQQHSWSASGCEEGSLWAWFVHTSKPHLLPIVVDF